jgi:hypothetical protein
LVVRPQRRALRGLPLAGTAVVGVVLGHWLAYSLAVPAPTLRAEILAASGHSYWLLAMKAALVLGLVALGTVLIRHLGARVRGEQAVAETLPWLAARLAGLQVLAFTAMEVTERIAAHQAAGQMFRHHIFLLGVAVQLAVAVAVAFVLLWFARAARRIVSAIAIRTSPGPPAASTRFDLQLAPRPRAMSGAASVRGPPRRLSS